MKNREQGIGNREQGTVVNGQLAGNCSLACGV